jgi:hypothetical protein
LGVKDFDPCTILLNNDLAAGVPGILEDITGQYLLPPLHASWSTSRRAAPISKPMKKWPSVLASSLVLIPG